VLFFLSIITLAQLKVCFLLVRIIIYSLFFVGLWKEVLESKYGLTWLSNSYVPKRNRFTSRWWIDLFKVSISDKGDNWFNQNMFWKVGSGEGQILGR